MNVKLLRMSTRDDNGARRWTVPGTYRRAVLIPSRVMGDFSYGAVFRWPATRPDGFEVMRNVDLSRHRALAKQEALRLIYAGL